MIKKLLLALTLTGVSLSAYPLTASQVQALAIGETDSRIAALNQAVVDADDKTAAFLQALADDAVKVSGSKVWIVRGGQGVDPVTGATAPLPTDAEDVVSNNRMRSELDTALGAIRLFSADDTLRAAAVKALATEPDPARLPLIDKALNSEKNPTIKAQLVLARAAVLLGSAYAAERADAAQALARSGEAVTRTRLTEALQREQDPAARQAMTRALREVEAALAWGDRAGQVYGAALCLSQRPACLRRARWRSRHWRAQ